MRNVLTSHVCARAVRGANATICDPVWKYATLRRLLIFVEQFSDEGMQWEVWGPNERTEGG